MPASESSSDSKRHKPIVWLPNEKGFFSCQAWGVGREMKSCPTKFSFWVSSRSVEGPVFPTLSDASTVSLSAAKKG
jgi:hypothetical protein